jgi:Fic family protein
MLEALNRLETESGRQVLREEDLRSYHRLLSDPRAPGAGEYRKGQAVVEDSKTPRPTFQKVPALMMQLGEMISKEQAALDAAPDSDAVLTFALKVHQRIAFIHPFADGNGRVARLAMNYILRRYKLGYVVLPPLSESPEHFTALEEAHRGNLQPLRELANRHHYRV